MEKIESCLKAWSRLSGTEKHVILEKLKAREGSEMGLGMNSNNISINRVAN